MPKKYDLTNQKFDRLTAKEYIGNGKWECECECGKTVYVRTDSLTSGRTKSCGCLNQENIRRKKRNFVDYAGKTYGTVKVLKYVRSGKRGTEWLCHCNACGKNKIIVASDLKKLKTCGCEMIAAGNRNIENYRKITTESGTNKGIILREKPNNNNKTTGIRGVCYIKTTGYYVAYITYKGKRYTLKRSHDINECIRARKEAEKQTRNDFFKWYEKQKRKR